MGLCWAEGRRVVQEASWRRGHLSTLSNQRGGEEGQEESSMGKYGGPDEPWRAALCFFCHCQAQVTSLTQTHE